MFWLYRPTAPAVRAQSIQVVHAAHASAVRGHHVTLCVQPDRAGRAASEILAFYGLAPVDGLDLRVLPVGNTAASVGFRAIVARWAMGGGTFVARSKRYADQAMALLGDRVDLVLEAHEVDSLQAAERGEDPSGIRELEARVLARARGVICNCEGTAELLREAHPDAPTAAVLHNASHPGRRREPEGSGEGIGYAGSLRGFKDPGLLADAARISGQRWTVVGPESDPELVARSERQLSFEPAIAHRDLPDRLARFAVLVLPVAPGLFGERLTSPLKLWDYLGAGRPIVATDTPAIRAAAGDAARYVPVSDPGAMARAAVELARAPSDGAALVQRARARFRTWDDRAAELDAFLDRVLP